MIPTDDGDGYVLSTGRLFRVNCGIIGLGSATDTPTGGYDDGIEMDSNGYDTATDWTQAERDELADYMIALWTEWKRTWKSSR